MAQFSRILRFSHIYCQIFRRVPFVDGSDGPLNSECITSTIESEKFQTFIILAQYFEIMTKRKRNYQSTDISPVNDNYKLNYIFYHVTISIEYEIK